MQNFINHYHYKNLKKLNQKFINASPFPHVVIDDFFSEDFALSLIKEINSYNPKIKSRDYVFAKNKFEEPDLNNIGNYSKQLKLFFLSEMFNDFLSKLTGEKSHVDPEFIGGGLHKGGKSSFLDMHVDFQRHPSKKNWMRYLNILIYLNQEWESSYKGSLDLKNKITNQSTTIDPLFNRCVIMVTNDISLHGYAPINFPDNKYRTSIAAYSYLIKDEKEIKDLSTTTRWSPGFKRRKNLKTLLARFAFYAVQIKQKIFGSSTAKRSIKK